MFDPRWTHPNLDSICHKWQSSRRDQSFTRSTLVTARCCRDPSAFLEPHSFSPSFAVVLRHFGSPSTNYRPAATAASFLGFFPFQFGRRFSLAGCWRRRQYSFSRYSITAGIIIFVDPVSISLSFDRYDIGATGAAAARSTAARTMPAAATPGEEGKHQY